MVIIRLINFHEIVRRDMGGFSAKTRNIQVALIMRRNRYVWNGGGMFMMGVALWRCVLCYEVFFVRLVTGIYTFFLRI